MALKLCPKALKAGDATTVAAPVASSKVGSSEVLVESSCDVAVKPSPVELVVLKVVVATVADFFGKRKRSKVAWVSFSSWRKCELFLGWEIYIVI